MSTLVGKQAPEFKNSAVAGGKIISDFTLSQFKGKYVILFFYPLDFTFVCPTELHAFAERESEFTARGAQIIGCSVDSVYSHAAWLATPRQKGGIEGVNYPLVSDINKTISRDYGVLNPAAGIAYRGLFLIDKEGIVRHALVNDLPLGRSVDETLRMLDALIFFEENGEVCPANWQKGKATMKPTQEGLMDYFLSSKSSEPICK